MNYTMLPVQLGDKVRVLAVAADERVETLPDVPTFKELGYNIVGGAFRGVAAPKGTPKEIVDKLADAFTRTNKKIAGKQVPLGFVMTYATGEKAKDLVDQMRKSYSDVLNDILEEQKKK